MIIAGLICLLFVIIMVQMSPSTLLKFISSIRQDKYLSYMLLGNDCIGSDPWPMTTSCRLYQHSDIIKK